MSRNRRVIDTDYYEEEKNRNQHGRGTRKKSKSDGQFDLSGIDLNQISSLLQNVDINQISSIVSSLGGLGGLGSIGSLLNKGASDEDSDDEGSSEVGEYRGDKRIELLYALKPMVSPNRANLIDIIIQLYLINRILKR